ncbi:MAG TPA: GrpB family protein [Candidatus Limnocylindrales bacterium]|nr:GrpB family protein [Candidatus Limnocylindrales bacterium]
MPTFSESIAAGGRVVGRDRDDRKDPIKIFEYDSAWRDRYEEMRLRLLDALGELALRIEHVGSTSVPGLPAKPIVDIQVSVPDVDDDDAFRALIESLGFQLRFIEAGHRYFQPPPGQPRTYQIHVCTIGGDWERVHLLFRDYLRAHPQVAYEYGAMKKRLAGQYATDRIQYNDEKGPFITAVLAAAEDWAAETDWTP